jgi:hypothetical protein
MTLVFAAGPSALCNSLDEAGLGLPSKDEVLPY